MQSYFLLFFSFLSILHGSLSREQLTREMENDLSSMDSIDIISNIYLVCCGNL